MIQVILFGVLAFVLGIGGGAGFRILTAPKAVPAAHDGADSTAVAHGDSVHAEGGAPHAQTVAAHADAARADTAAQAPAHAVEAPATAGHGPAESPQAPAAPEGVTEPQQFKQVGNILLAMKPEEAGRILAYLSDDHVEGILRSMGPRQAATVLTQLPSARAAVLSRRLLAPGTEGGAH